MSGTAVQTELYRTTIFAAMLGFSTVEQVLAEAPFVRLNVPGGYVGTDLEFALDSGVIEPVNQTQQAPSTTPQSTQSDATDQAVFVVEFNEDSHLDASYEDRIPEFDDVEIYDNTDYDYSYETESRSYGC